MVVVHLENLNFGRRKKGKLNLQTRILGAIFLCLVSFQPSPFLESFSPRRGIKYGGWKISGIKLHPEDPGMGGRGGSLEIHK